MTLDLQTTIEQGWENRANLSPSAADTAVREAVEHTVDALDTGRLRVAEKINGKWEVHQWIKKQSCCHFVCMTMPSWVRRPCSFLTKSLLNLRTTVKLLLKPAVTE